MYSRPVYRRPPPRRRFSVWLPTLVPYRGGLFDGTNDYLSRSSDLAGNADGKTGTVSFWVKFTNAAVADEIVYQVDRFFVYRQGTDGSIAVAGYDTTGTLNLFIASSTIPSVGDWHHVVASWDLATPSTAMYIDGRAETLASSFTVNIAIDYTRAGHGVGASDIGGAKLSGDLAQLWLDTTSYNDLTQPATLAKFVEQIGGYVVPVIMGDDGSLPTGSQPILYLDNPPDLFHLNRGSGGDFTANGALTDLSGMPMAVYSGGSFDAATVFGLSTGYNAGLQATLSGAVPLGLTTGLSHNAQAVVEGSTTLPITQGLSHNAQAVVEGSTTLPITQGISDTAVVTTTGFIELQETLNLVTTGQVVGNPVVTMQLTPSMTTVGGTLTVAAITLPITQGLTTVSGITVLSDVTFNTTMGVANDAQRGVNAGVTLAGVFGVIAATTANVTGSITLAFTGDVGVSAQANVSAAITAALTAGYSTVSSRISDVSVSLGVGLTIADAVIADYFAGVDLGATLAVAAAAGADVTGGVVFSTTYTQTASASMVTDGGVTLGVTFTQTADGIISNVSATAPDKRTIQVSLDSRTIIVNADSGTSVVAASGRTIPIQ